ncbi:MAG: ABC transporter permease subunit/CPBP intramembrane protease [Candidatus Cloacimonadaceae bacterium]|nr:ABC transporter permease subunit/CPBP intramembrane protease [Candidatus Cloacimonadaceae bacterium]MDP3115139.1 ABC transporter permease subunit/CPBP intramembrane protease [Candidatus Cloacimonadaceae bacterium]
MNFKKAGIVFRKEFLEMLRDKRTLFTTIILPVIMYPMLFIGFSSIMSRQTRVLEERGAYIAVRDSVNDEVSLKLLKDLAGIANFSFQPYTAQTPSLYKERSINAIISITDSLTNKGLSTYKIDIQYDAAKQRDQMIFAKLRNQIALSEKQILQKLLTKQKVDPQIMQLVSVRERDTSTAQKKVGMYLGMFLPYLMIIMLIAGAATVAADLVAGEKERKTLETLLVSSAQRNEIVLGKYLTIVSMAMINVVINLLSIGFSLHYVLSQSRMEMVGMAMPLKGFAILMLAMLPLATLFAAVLLSISTFSRNMKEARSYEQPILTVSMLLAMISFFPAIEINNLMALIPVVNISLLFKAVMINEYQLSHVIITIASTLVLVILAVILTVKLFNTESILFRTEDDSSFKNVRKDKRSFFNSYYGLVYFAIGLAILYYAGGYLQSRDMLKGLIQTQFLVILLPVLIILKLLKLKSNDILRIKAPRLGEILLIPFIAIPATIIVSMVGQLINHFFPFPIHYLEQLAGLFKLDSSIWVMLFAIAVMPAICEEVLFRGFMIRFYESYGTKSAIIISALLFAIFHLDPFRLLPTFMLGILLGYLTIRTKSIIPSMLSHFINNGFALFIITYANTAWVKPLLKNSDSLQPWILVPAIIIFAAAIYTFHKYTNTKEISCAE